MTEESQSPEVPVCLGCLTPYDPLEHYCSNCGTVVGQFTPYLPFVSIPFSYSIFERLWARIWSGDAVPLVHKLLYWALIVWWAPVLLVGIPFMFSHRRSSGGFPAV